MAINQDLFDEIVENALEILRLSAGERKKVEAVLRKMEKELRSQLSEADFSVFSKELLKKVLDDGYNSIAKFYEEISSVIEFPDIALYVARSTKVALKVALGIDGRKLPSRAYLKSVKSNVMIEGAPSSAWWQAQSNDTQFKFAQQVRMGLIAGETNQQIIARIVGKSGVPGVMDTVRRNAAALVQTSVQAVANDSRRQTFKANDDIVKGITQVSTLDSHTSNVCVAYSGCQWDLDFKPIGAKRLPFKGGTPRHFSCRSLEIAITKTFAEMGLDVPEPKPTTRASDEGQISADTTFDGFLKRKTKEYQDEMLGEGKAKLWRESKITLRDLVNGEGRERTLKELFELVKRRERS